MRVIVCLTTHPGRNGTVQPTIDCLRAQTRQPDDIRLYYGAGVEDLPSDCTCIRVTDIGPATKWSAAADASLAPDDVLVICDDDYRYHTGWLAALLAEHKQAPDIAVGFSGWTYAPLVASDTGSYGWPAHGPVDVLEGYAGIAIAKRLLPASVLAPPLTYRHVDDVWVSACLHRAGVQRRKVPYPLGRILDGSDPTRPGLHTRPDFRALNRAACRRGFLAPPPVLLTICIISIPRRAASLGRLLAQLAEQPRSREVEILVSTDGGQRTKGEKRNDLVRQARGAYIAHIDDDDGVAPEYIDRVLSAIERTPGVDAVTIRGLRRAAGLRDLVFDHRLEPDPLSPSDAQGVDWHNPGHLCAVRVDLARRWPFPHFSSCEDWSQRQNMAAELRTTVKASETDEILYHYAWEPRKKMYNPADAPHDYPTHESIFTPQYVSDSGPGSAPEYTEPYRKWLEAFCKKNKIKSVIDMPCGDMRVGGAVALPKGCTYLGVDVIAERIARNREAFPDREFVQADLLDWTPPPADLLIIKDCVQHWSTADVLRWLESLKRAKFRFALVINCSYGPTLNADIVTGGWRALDLSLAPFGVGESVFAWGPDDHHKRVVLLKGDDWHAGRTFRAIAPLVQVPVMPAPAGPQPALSICIASLSERSAQLDALCAKLRAMPSADRVEILTDVDDGQTPVYAKRNNLLQRARGQYVCAVDDDDDLSASYLPELLAAIDAGAGADAVVFRAERTRDDDGPTVALDYYIGAAPQADGTDWRTPDHLTPVRADLAKRVPFPAVVDNEDVAWRKALLPLLKRIVRAGTEPLYFYRWSPQKPKRKHRIDAPGAQRSPPPEGAITVQIRKHGNGFAATVPHGAHYYTTSTNEDAVRQKALTWCERNFPGAPVAML